MPTNELDQPIGRPVPGWSPRPVPSGVIEGRFVRLEPLGEAHLPELFAQLCGPDDEGLWTYMPAGPFRLVTELASYVAPMLAAPDVVPYALVVDGRALGIATYLRVQRGAGSIEVGSITYGAALQRTVAATEAMYLMARTAFELGYRRYEWKCDSLNAPSRSAAERLGFTYEGRFRQALVYKGRNRDTDWYAMTDGDWERLAPAYERWLAGCDDQGRQSERLGDLTRAALAG